MKDLILIRPNTTHQKQVMDYKHEFIANNDSMDGTAGLRNVTNYKQWLEQLADNSLEATVHEGFVPATTYLAICLADQTLVGMIDIRHRLNDHLLKYGGHIGYSVKKTARGNGYAKSMLAIALIKCQELKINPVLITCDKDNIASAKTIIANNGILENEIEYDNKIIQRYWINL